MGKESSSIEKKIIERSRVDEGVALPKGGLVKVVGDIKEATAAKRVGEKSLEDTSCSFPARSVSPEKMLEAAHVPKRKPQ